MLSATATDWQESGVILTMTDFQNSLQNTIFLNLFLKPNSWSSFSSLGKVAECLGASVADTVHKQCFQEIIEIADLSPVVIIKY